MTKQRALVLGIIKDSSEHLTAEEIFMKAKEKMPGIAFATIYNNLNVLVDMKYIGRIKEVGTPDHFDRNITPHDHVVCDICGRLKDVTTPSLKSYIEDLINLKLTAYRLSMRYVCDSCKEKERKK